MSWMRTVPVAEMNSIGEAIVQSRQRILRVEVVEAPQLAQYSGGNRDVLGEYGKLHAAGPIGAIQEVQAHA